MLDALIAAEGQIDVLQPLPAASRPSIRTFRAIVEECVGRKEIL